MRCTTKTGLIMGLLVASLETAAMPIDSKCRIVVSESSPVRQWMHQAAETLCDAIKERSGVRIPVVTTVERGYRGSIFIGEEFAVRDGFDLSGFKDFDNLIAERNGNLYLCGRDWTASGRPASDYFRCRLPSVRAVARFMEEFLGVRFLAPGKTGMDIPKGGEITVGEGFHDLERTTQNFGAGRYNGLMYDMANGIFGTSAYFTYGGHTYPQACPTSRYYKDHPEYFAQIAGRRVADEHNPSLCISNPAVGDLIVEELIRRFDAGADVCQLGQNDGGIFCQCDCCARLYGTGPGDWGEKLWIFHRDIAERIRKLRPGKIVQILSYADTHHPPKTFKVFPENVMIEKCNPSEESFAEWRGYVVPHGFTAYVYLWGEHPHLGFTAKHSIAVLERFARCLLANGVHGVYRCGYGELFGVEGPGYWVFNRVLADPNKDARSLFDEYCRRAYGSAAVHMRRFHEILDARLASMPAARDWMDPTSGGATPLESLSYIYAPDVVARMDCELKKAEADNETDAKQRRRIGLVRTEFDYARNLGSIATLHAAYKIHPSDAAFRSLADEIRARNRMLDAFFTGPGRSMRKVEGWPELSLFGGFGRDMMQTNGRLGARIDAPLKWDVNAILQAGVLPGMARRRTSVGRDWKSAKWMEMQGPQLQRLPKKARFRMWYDDKALHVEIESDLEDGREVQAGGRDSNLCHDEFLDLVVDPTGDGSRIYHLIWAPVEGAFYDAALGLVRDPLNPRFGTYDPTWNGEDWTIANDRSGNVWRSTVTLPFEMLGAMSVKAGDVWRFNLSREWKAGADGESRIDAMWSPDVESGAFANPSAMGDVVFE